MTHAPHIRLSLLSLLSLSLLAGCGGNGDELPPPAFVDVGGGGAAPILDVGACYDEGEVRDCKVNIEQASGVMSCFYGIQFCVDGEWTGCLDEATPNPVAP